MNRLNAFVLSAGLGERLRPITAYIPKPLLPILGRPTLQYVLERINDIPVGRIGINLHYGRDAIEEWVKHSAFSDRIEFFYEEELLGTGGALRNAESLLGEGTFLVHNSDIITDMDLGRLVEYHLSSENMATLAIHDHLPFNSLEIDDQGFLKGIRQGSVDGLMAFTGVAVYSPEFLNLLPHGISSVVDGWFNAISKGFKIGTFNVDGCEWHDIGTPSSYAGTVFQMLKEKGEIFYIHPSSRGCEHASLSGYVVIEKGCRIGRAVSLRDCVVLPEVSIKDGSRHEGMIIGDGFKVNISLKRQAGDEKLLIGAGGSDRRFYRTIRNGHSVVVMYENNREDFRRMVEYTEFFRRHSVPVPELFDVDDENLMTWFEDLGDTSLYHWLRCQRDEREIEGIYKKVMDIMLLLHTAVTDKVSECPLLEERVFDLEYFRWESRYFVDEFVEGLMKVKVLNSDLLNNELDQIAQRADSFRKAIIHRDLQSQNIMLTEKGLYILDYQGARIGPPAYDVASFLWDPYYRLSDRLRQRLLDYYIEKIRLVYNEHFDSNDFMELLTICRLQRHMQALGAYGFLSTKKRKRYFLKYIPEGLRLLKEDINIAKDDYKELFNLVINLR